MYQYWQAYGIEKFGQINGLYQGFLFNLLSYKDFKEIEEIKYLEKIFEDCINEKDKETGNHILHYYVKNKYIKMEILRYLCTKYKDLVSQRNEKDNHVLHILCQNVFVNIEHLRYFVEELKVPISIESLGGWQPFQALHYLVDNDGVRWQKSDMKIMINNLKIDFMTRRGGEVILYRLSHQNNVSTAALIYLYRHYKNKVDLNSMISQKIQYTKHNSAGGRTILMNLVSRGSSVTPNQIRVLVK